MKQPRNNPHLTAIERNAISFPTRWLAQHSLLNGEILDFGCGYGYDTHQLQKQGYNIVGYDNYHRPDYPKKRFDTIICNYVLNVLEPNEQAEVLMAVSELLKPTGKAFYSVRRDLKKEGFRMHFVHKKPTYQCNVLLPFKSLYANENCEIYQYQPYNQLSRSDKGCPFCTLAPEIELLTETATTICIFR